MKKIGVCLTTFNRPDFYKKVLSSIPRQKIDYLVVINDGLTGYANDIDADLVIRNNCILGVGKSKNKGLKILIEDDILIKNELVFDAYIKAANTHGIHHLCYELAEDNHKYLKYSNTIDDITLNFYHNPQGPFMYMNSVLIKKFGYFDENYMNAFEHIDFAYNLIKLGIAPPFWYFPDISNSNDYLEYLDVEQKSTIRNEKIYSQQYKTSAEHFIKKWGHFTNQIPDLGIPFLVKTLDKLKLNYSRKISKNITDFFDKTYCINLDKRIDRWKSCEDLFKKFNLKVERYSALDGNLIAESKISKGALGLIRTNYKIIEEAKQKKINSILIMEDDVKFFENMSDIEEFFKFLPEDWDMIYFGGNHNTHMGVQPPCQVNSHVSKLHNTYTTHCVGINSKLYDVILNELRKEDRPLDVMYSDLQKNFNVYCFCPALVGQVEGFSDIEMKHTNYNWLIN